MSTGIVNLTAKTKTNTDPDTETNRNALAMIHDRLGHQQLQLRNPFDQTDGPLLLVRYNSRSTAQLALTTVPYTR